MARRTRLIGGNGGSSGGLARSGGVLLLAALLAAGLSPAPAAAQDDGLSRMAGEWVGRGTVRRGPGEPAERVYCRVTNRLESGGDALVQSGRCAAGSTTGRISGTINATGGGYRGTLSTPEMEGDASVNGDGGRNGIRLSGSYRDRENGRTIRSNISISFAEAGYRLQATAEGPDLPSYSATDITFTRARE